MAFELHLNLLEKIFIFDLPLCRVLLEDEKNYPWLLLIPRKPNIKCLTDLDLSDQLQLMRELNFAQKIVIQKFHPTQINIAAIGNKTPQLHVHVIGRFHNDPAWPGTVWDHPERSFYSQKEKKKIVEQLQAAFQKEANQASDLL